MKTDDMSLEELRDWRRETLKAAVLSESTDFIADLIEQAVEEGITDDGRTLKDWTPGSNQPQIVKVDQPNSTSPVFTLKDGRRFRALTHVGPRFSRDVTFVEIDARGREVSRMTAHNAGSASLSSLLLMALGW